MIHFITCNGYRTIGETNDRINLPHRCAVLESERDDGYGVLAMEDSKFIADANGYYQPEPHTVDHATQTGMYDRY